MTKTPLSEYTSEELWDELARRAVQAEFEERARDVEAGDEEEPYRDLQDAADTLSSEIQTMAFKVNDDDSYDFLPPVAYGTFLSDAIDRVFPSKD